MFRRQRVMCSEGGGRRSGRGGHSTLSNSILSALKSLCVCVHPPFSSLSIHFLSLPRWSQRSNLTPSGCFSLVAQVLRASGTGPCRWVLQRNPRESPPPPDVCVQTRGSSFMCLACLLHQIELCLNRGSRWFRAFVTDCLRASKWTTDVFMFCSYFWSLLERYSLFPKTWFKVVAVACGCAAFVVRFLVYFFYFGVGVDYV